MDVQDMRIFARVAAVQNLSAVGLELGLTPGTISKRIQALEEEFSVRLFDRTTRSIRITEEGAKLLEHVERILADIELARAAVTANVGKPQGRLRVSAPASFGRHIVAPAICAFLELYADIDVQVDLTDRLVNLHEEGYDVVIRAATLADSGLKAKRLAADPQVLVASPAYLERRGVPRTPADLANHSCLVLGEQVIWSLDRGGEQTSIRVTGRLRSDNGELLRHAALEGHGIARMSRMRVREDLRRGLLVSLLTDYSIGAQTAIWALYPSGRHVLPKLRVFLDFLGEWFRDEQVNGHPVRTQAVPPPKRRPREAGRRRAAGARG